MNKSGSDSSDALVSELAGLLQRDGFSSSVSSVFMNEKYPSEFNSIIFILKHCISNQKEYSKFFDFLINSIKTAHFENLKTYLNVYDEFSIQMKNLAQIRNQNESDSQEDQIVKKLSEIKEIINYQKNDIELLQLESQVKENPALKEEIAALKEEIIALNEKNTALNKKKSDFKKKNSDLEKEKSDLEKEKNNLKKEKSDLKKKLDKEKSDLEKKLDKEKSDLEKKLEKEKSVLQKEKSDLEKKLDKEKSVLQKEKIDLEKNISTLKDEKSSLELSADKLKTEIQKFHDKYDNIEVPRSSNDQKAEMIRKVVNFNNVVQVMIRNLAERDTQIDAYLEHMRKEIIDKKKSNK